MPAKKAAVKTKARKTPLKKAPAKRARPKKKAGKTANQATPRASGRSATMVKRSSIPAERARRGDRIVIDSVHVGSPAREGEILKVSVGALSVSYQVRWGDGHETFITPVAGTAHIVRT